MTLALHRMAEMARRRQADRLALRTLPFWRPMADDPLNLLLLGIGLLGQVLRSVPQNPQRLALVGADAYLLVCLLAAGRSIPPPTDKQITSLAAEQLERYTSNPNGNGWLRRTPLEHLMRSFAHWVAVAPVLSIESSEEPRGVTRLQLADLANYLTFVLETSGAFQDLRDSESTER